MATVTSLSARLMLTDVSFSKTLQKSEKEAEKFGKNMSKMAGGVANLTALTSNINGVASSTAGANSAITTFTGSLSTTTSTVTASISAVVGLRSAIRSLKTTMMTNPLTAAFVVAAAAIGVVVALVKAFSGDTEAALQKARQAEEHAKELDKRAAEINTRMRQVRMNTNEKELDSFRQYLQQLVAAGEITQRDANTRLRSLQRVQEAEARVTREREAQARIAQQGKAADDAVANMQEREENAGKTKAQLERDHYRDTLIAGDASYGAVDELMEQYDRTIAKEEEAAAQRQRIADAEKQRADLNRQLAEFEQQANQAWMTDQERKLAKLKELGATEEQLARARKAMEAADAPRREQQRIQKELGERKKQLADLDQQEMAIESARGRGFADAPKALLKGTAEAALAESQRKNPVEQLTDLQKKQLAEIQKQRALAERQVALLEKEKEQVAQF